MSRNYGLIDENPLFVYPSLCGKVGINEGIALQYIHFIVELKGEESDDRTFWNGEMWCSKTLKKWQERMPWFKGVDGIFRLMRRMEETGLLISSKPDAIRRDQTKWYRINYDFLERIVAGEVDYFKLVKANSDARKARSASGLSREKEDSDDSENEDPISDSGLSPRSDSGLNVISDSGLNDLYKKDFIKTLDLKTVSAFSNSPRAAETETSTSYNVEPNHPSIENPLKPNPTILVQAQQFPTAQPQAEVKPSQPAEAQNEADQLQLPLSQKKEKAEIVDSAQQSKESPPSHGAPPPLSTGKGKQKKNTLSAEQEATFLAIYLEERSSNMVKHQSLPEGAKKHLYDLTQKYPDNYCDVFRGGMQSLREREDGWWRDEKKSFTLVNIMTDGKMQGHYETHVLDMGRNPNYVRRVQGLAPSKDKGRQQMSVLDEAGNPVSNELAQMVATYQNADPALRMILGLGKQEDV